MAHIQIPLNGIGTSSLYNEGESFSLVNLRKKNGSLQPVAPRKILQALSQSYDLIFVHQNNDYKNWIGVVNTTYNSSIYWNILDTPRSISSYADGKINSIEQIGNTLALITNEHIYYLLFQGDTYRFLGELPSIPTISFNTSPGMSHAELYFYNEYGGGRVNPDNFIEATKGLVYKAMETIMHGGTDKNGEPIGGFGLQLFDAHFVRYAFRLYDGTLTKHSPPILIMPIKDILTIKTIDYDFDNALRDESKIDVYGYRIYMDYDFLDLTSWRDIIQSIDIFMSPALGLSNIENIRNDMPTSDSPHLLHYNLIKELPPEAMKDVCNNSSFYYMRSIELGSYTIFESDALPSTEDDISRMENLIHQEVMSDDNFSNHIYGSQCSFAYNNRLHIANIHTQFFQGFHPGYFLTSSTYNGVERNNRNVSSLVIEVEIQTGATTGKVYSVYQFYGSESLHFFSTAFLSYPDPRAKRITLYEVSGGTWYRILSVPLQPHNFLNLVYYLSPGLKPITSYENRTPIGSAPNVNNRVTLSEPNKIKVSELNNPLNFPVLNVYQAGNGSILSMAANTMNVSDRNFGQYPVYIFSDEGIWTLNVGSGEVVYSTITTPTSLERPINSITCSLPFGVVFITERGLMLLSGQSIELISGQLSEDSLAYNIELPEPTEDVIHNFPITSFKEYIKQVDNIIYDNNESELILTNKQHAYNYVYNFNSQTFYLSTEKIDYPVKNIFPQLLVVEDRRLKDFSATNTPQAHVSIITRPLLMGTHDIKRLTRMKLQAIIFNLANTDDNKRSVIMAHYSNDGINFHPARGLYLYPGNYKDYDLGIMARMKFKYFLFSMGANIEESSRITLLEAIADKENLNDKIR